MTIESTDNDQGNSFEYRLREVSDDEIVNILRFREHFQPHAVKAAIKEALKRGIISSIDDLEKDKFKSQPLPPRSLFPINNIESQNEAVFKSLGRITYGVSLLPVIYGIIQLVNSKLVIGSIALITGLLIIFLIYKLNKERKNIYAQFLLFFNLPSIGYASYYLISSGKPSSMDIFTALIVVIIILYTTLYLHILSIHFNKNSAN